MATNPAVIPIQNNKALRERLEQITRIVQSTLSSHPYCEIWVKRNGGMATITKTFKTRVSLKFASDSGPADGSYRNGESQNG